MLHPEKIPFIYSYTIGCSLVNFFHRLWCMDPFNYLLSNFIYIFVYMSFLINCNQNEKTKHFYMPS